VHSKGGPLALGQVIGNEVVLNSGGGDCRIKSVYAGEAVDHATRILFSCLLPFSSFRQWDMLAIPPRSVLSWPHLKGAQGSWTVIIKLNTWSCLKLVWSFSKTQSFEPYKLEGFCTSCLFSGHVPSLTANTLSTGQLMTSTEVVAVELARMRIVTTILLDI
jgi:hypothetical protein